ncbi:MAG: hypothetical protein GY826_39935 [Fuerstiella sp.]|nr:hypothetical protein [Fuerstiella sp.]
MQPTNGAIRQIEQMFANGAKWIDNEALGVIRTALVAIPHESPMRWMHL